MKTGEMLTVTALAIAAGLVLIPRRASAAAPFRARNVSAPRVGAGDGATVWNDARTAQYREQLAGQAGNDWTGP